MVLPMGAIRMAGGVPRPSPGPLVPSVCGGGDGGGGVRQVAIVQLYSRE